MNDCGQRPETCKYGDACADCTDGSDPDPTVPPMQFADLQHRFNHHAPPNGTTAQKHITVRERCLELAEVLDGTQGDGREKSLAITKLEEAMMWANAGIARENAVMSPHKEQST
jgi:hypothetical protein